jgi:AraC family transcriptional regulator, regulatory protein of adaptative response / methylated-DNA-[protein]-cysteine methyltransferase
MTQRRTVADARRWAQVLRRVENPRAVFVFGVGTTGVYCRPGCPARMPNRENVRFFRTPREAEGAGFRACKRCRPAVGAARAERARRR